MQELSSVNLQHAHITLLSLDQPFMGCLLPCQTSSPFKEGCHDCTENNGRLFSWLFYPFSECVTKRL